VKSGEIIASMLLTWHNIAYYQDLMAALRDAIAQSRLHSYVSKIADLYRRVEEAH
jgi:queuine tRNA-ribosyltransferase